MELTKQMLNEVLPETSCATVRALLSDIEQDMARLDAQVLCKTKELQGLTSQWKEKFDEAAKCKMALSTQKKLPPELLSEIFSHCGPDRYDTRLPVSSYDHMPFKLLHVCSRWRKVALDTPRLWTALDIWLDGDSDPEFDDMYRQFIVMCRRAKLSAHFVVDGFHHCSRPSPLADILLSNTSRFENLYIQFRMGETEHSLFRRTSSFQNLKSLVLCDTPSSQTRGLYTLFKDAPLLRRLEITLFGRILYPPSFDLPWMQLTDLQASIVSSSDAYTLLPQCSNLERCIITIREHATIEPGPTITLFKLVKLRIELHLDVPVSMFLSRLTLPSLNMLDVRLSPFNRYTPPPHAEVAALLSRSSCALTTFWCDWLSSTQVEPIMQASPSLEEIVLLDTEIPLVAVTRMARQGLVPNLRILRCRVSQVVVAEALADMLELRRWSTGPDVPGIQFVKLHYAQAADFPSQLRARLRQLNDKSQGISVGDEILQR
ncbi:hypothetical protein Hypma_000628 [Hypsizygus marmoreus]|uniref:Uncharacterized protein n=1 Tax=Hypsizygus marmoreus TaxID=39966 RepID=A0A369J8G6_HYPMA|nr:hypothetical protein Hypma_000628 [Hypsizygus marmoreus]